MTLSVARNPTTQELAIVVNQLLLGQMNNTGTVTLTASVASTTVSDKRCKTGSYVSLMPTTANAATEYGAGTWRIATSNGSFVITHVNNAQVDRTFIYVIMG